MEINKEREAFEQHLSDTGLVEFAGYGFLVDECDEYLHEPTQVAWDAWQLGARRRFSTIPKYAEFHLGGGVYTICDWEDYESVKEFKWNTSSRQSRTQWAWAHDPKNGGITRKKVAMHNLIMCPPENHYVDHINGNGLDNRRVNLRIVTKQQNTFNSASKGGSSIYKGVCRDKQCDMWVAYITKDGKKRTIGRFEFEDDAARAYDKEAMHLFGEYAKLNFKQAMIEAQEQSHD
ncbi:HNH endonuclease [Acinetobacter sp. ULE_I037]|uniref:HNH endonuclease n=2 Tax=unclassified Acinetobacter TaxID=196816 RepID=UPI003AF66CB6